MPEVLVFSEMHKVVLQISFLFLELVVMWVRERGSCSKQCCTLLLLVYMDSLKDLGRRLWDSDCLHGVRQSSIRTGRTHNKDAPKGFVKDCGRHVRIACGPCLEPLIVNLA